MQWSRAMRARRLRLLPGQRRRTEVCRQSRPIACSSLVASHLLIPTSTPMTSPLSRAGGSGNSTHTMKRFSDKTQPWTRRRPAVPATLAYGDIMSAIGGSLNEMQLDLCFLTPLDLARASLTVDAVVLEESSNRSNFREIFAVRIVRNRN